LRKPFGLLNIRYPLAVPHRLRDLEQPAHRYSVKIRPLDRKHSDKPSTSAVH
jgi:hypothetical protein